MDANEFLNREAMIQWHIDKMYNDIMKADNIGRGSFHVGPKHEKNSSGMPRPLTSGQSHPTNGVTWKSRDKQNKLKCNISDCEIDTLRKEDSYLDSRKPRPRNCANLLTSKNIHGPVRYHKICSSKPHRTQPEKRIAPNQSSLKEHDHLNVNNLNVKISKHQYTKNMFDALCQNIALVNDDNKSVKGKLIEPRKERMENKFRLVGRDKKMSLPKQGNTFSKKDYWYEHSKVYYQDESSVFKSDMGHSSLGFEQSLSGVLNDHSGVGSENESSVFKSDMGHSSLGFEQSLSGVLNDHSGVRSENGFSINDFDHGIKMPDSSIEPSLLIGRTKRSNSTHNPEVFPEVFINKHLPVDLNNGLCQSVAQNEIQCNRYSFKGRAINNYPLNSDTLLTGNLSYAVDHVGNLREADSVTHKKSLRTPVAQTIHSETYTIENPGWDVCQRVSNRSVSECAFKSPGSSTDLAAPFSYAKGEITLASKDLSPVHSHVTDITDKNASLEHKATTDPSCDSDSDCGYCDQQLLSPTERTSVVRKRKCEMQKAVNKKINGRSKPLDEEIAVNPSQRSLCKLSDEGHAAVQKWCNDVASNMSNLNDIDNVTYIVDDHDGISPECPNKPPGCDNLTVENMSMRRGDIQKPIAHPGIWNCTHHSSSSSAYCSRLSEFVQNSSQCCVSSDISCIPNVGFSTTYTIPNYAFVKCRKIQEQSSYESKLHVPSDSGRTMPKGSCRNQVPGSPEHKLPSDSRRTMPKGSCRNQEPSSPEHKLPSDSRRSMSKGSCRNQEPGSPEHKLPSDSRRSMPKGSCRNQEPGSQEHKLPSDSRRSMPKGSCRNQEPGSPEHKLPSDSGRSMPKGSCRNQEPGSPEHKLPSDSRRSMPKGSYKNQEPGLPEHKLPSDSRRSMPKGSCRNQEPGSPEHKLPSDSRSMPKGSCRNQEPSSPEHKLPSDSRKSMPKGSCRNQEPGSPEHKLPSDSRRSMPKGSCRNQEPGSPEHKLPSDSRRSMPKGSCRNQEPGSPEHKLPSDSRRSMPKGSCRNQEPGSPEHKLPSDSERSLPNRSCKYQEPRSPEHKLPSGSRRSLPKKSCKYQEPRSPEHKLPSDSIRSMPKRSCKHLEAKSTPSDSRSRRLRRSCNSQRSVNHDSSYKKTRQVHEYTDSQESDLVDTSDTASDCSNVSGFCLSNRSALNNMGPVTENRRQKMKENRREAQRENAKHSSGSDLGVFDVPLESDDLVPAPDSSSAVNLSHDHQRFKPVKSDVHLVSNKTFVIKSTCNSTDPNIPEVSSVFPELSTIAENVPLSDLNVTNIEIHNALNPSIRTSREVYCATSPSNTITGVCKKGPSSINRLISPTKKVSSFPADVSNSTKSLLKRHNGTGFTFTTNVSSTERNSEIPWQNVPKSRLNIPSSANVNSGENHATCERINTNFASNNLSLSDNVSNNMQNAPDDDLLVSGNTPSNIQEISVSLTDSRANNIGGNSRRVPNNLCSNSNNNLPMVNTAFNTTEGNLSADSSELIIIDSSSSEDETSDSGCSNASGYCYTRRAVLKPEMVKKNQHRKRSPCTKTIRARSSEENKPAANVGGNIRSKQQNKHRDNSNVENKTQNTKGSRSSKNTYSSTVQKHLGPRQPLGCKNSNDLNPGVLGRNNFYQHTSKKFNAGVTSAVVTSQRKRKKSEPGDEGSEGKRKKWDGESAEHNPLKQLSDMEESVSGLNLLDLNKLIPSPHLLSLPTDSYSHCKMQPSLLRAPTLTTSVLPNYPGTLFGPPRHVGGVWKSIITEK